MKNIAFVVLFLLLLSPLELSAQCSDAGACSIGGSMHEQESDAAKHSLTLRYGYGQSGKTDELRFHALQLEADIQILTHSSLGVRLPWTKVEGPRGSASGIGDLLLIWDQQLWTADDIALHAQGGVKLATGEDNAEALPQSYQPGLGTNDLLFGLSLAYSRWHVAAAYQYSPGRSANAITRLRRGDDIMLRGGYATDISDMHVGIELLAVKRLSLSSVLDATAEGGEIFLDVPGSDQFQLNLAAQASLPLSDVLSVLAHTAVPLLKREVNVDGLTRALTVSAGLRMHF
ncbi:MAG: hypothetical protein M5R41_05435 [Bacteroidia bacterium]|nr:hypothetical protein [Bacteroidia bacterium]